MLDLKDASDDPDIAGEFLNFSHIPEIERLNRRPDLCAFLYLDKLFTDNGLLDSDGSDIIYGSEHDEIGLNINCNDLAKIATKEDILYLVRCGILYYSEFDCLCMYV
jgi:hypothetical protein